MKPVNRAFAVQNSAIQQVDIGALKDAPVSESKAYLYTQSHVTHSKADEILRSVSTDVSFPQQLQHTPNKKEKRILKHELFIERTWRLFCTRDTRKQMTISFHHFASLLLYDFPCTSRSAMGYYCYSCYYVRHPSSTIDGRDEWVSGLEASRAPYSKSHARRLKRKQKEQLAGGLGLLKAALPSIAPIAASAAERSAGEERDAAAATDITTATATAAGGGASAKLIARSKPATVTPDPGKAPQAALPGQIGEGKGNPLTRSQRRRALYGPIVVSLRIRN